MKPTTNKSFVYVISEVGTCFVKIGISQDPQQRLRELQTANPRKLAILATWPGGKPEEATYHRMLSDFRREGEWFELHDCILRDVLRGQFSAKRPTRQRRQRRQTGDLSMLGQFALVHLDTVRQKPSDARSAKRWEWLKANEPRLRAGSVDDVRVADEIQRVLFIHGK